MFTEYHVIQFFPALSYHKNQRPFCTNSSCTVQTVVLNSITVQTVVLHSITVQTVVLHSVTVQTVYNNPVYNYQLPLPP